MKRHPPIRLLSVLLVFVACTEIEEGTEAPLNETFLFVDGFETQNNTVAELLPQDGSRWTTVQQVNPSNGTNEISITDVEFSEGKNALRVYANQSDANLSKMDIEKNGLRIESGDMVTINADFYLNSEESLENLFLIDLECCSCWDPTVGDNYGAENQCPGVRLMLAGEEGFLSIERGKIAASTLQQTSFSFPRNQWVSVQWQMTVSDKDNGTNQLRINNIKVIDESAMNLPNAQIFKEVFAKEGIEFALRQPTFYERVQIGATANPTAGNIELFVDNFSINVE